MQYDLKTDAIVYATPAVREFDREDWARLAMAAADQAGLSLADQAAMAVMFRRTLGMPTDLPRMRDEVQP